MQFQQLAMAQFPAMIYLLAYAATMCRHFSSGNIILLTAATNQSNLVQYWKGSQAAQWEIAWPTTEHTHSIGAGEYLHTIGVSWEFNQFGVASNQGSGTYDCLDFVRKLMEQQFIWLLGLCCCCHQYVTEDASYFGSQLLEWNIPWYPFLTIVVKLVMEETQEFLTFLQPKPPGQFLQPLLLACSGGT
jgi:hypothetical protein